MRARELAVEGALEFTPEVFHDERGFFVSPFQGTIFNQAAGGGLFPVLQASLNLSKRGVVRGLHFTRTPPGMARYVYCPRGSALDVVADIRLGSPTFGRSDTVLLDGSLRAVYLPVGVGHAFTALEDDTVICYLLSCGYAPDHEFSLSVLDPELALPLPLHGGIEPIMSERDRTAMTLAEARARGLLPRYDDCLKQERELRPVRVPS